MDSSIAARGLGTLALCAIAAGCATITPVPYSEMASSTYMAPQGAGISPLACMSRHASWRNAVSLRVRRFPSVLCFTMNRVRERRCRSGTCRVITGRSNSPYVNPARQERAAAAQ
ncbi:hypothetical protein [Bradyrhizobium cenepequi]